METITKINVGVKRLSQILQNSTGMVEISYIPRYITNPLDNRSINTLAKELSEYISECSVSNVTDKNVLKKCVSDFYANAEQMRKVKVTWDEDLYDDTGNVLCEDIDGNQKSFSLQNITQVLINNVLYVKVVN